jgi:hypothetical protein
MSMKGEYILLIDCWVRWWWWEEEEEEGEERVLCMCVCARWVGRSLGCARQ